MSNIFTANDLVYLIRILLAVLCGAVIGFERQQRVKVAGLRTHILISLAAALMMIISKYGFMDVAGMDGLSCDVSRVAAGIITGIGILSGGIIFIGKRGNVSGITTAAGIWATIGIGMAIGAGMYAVGIGSVILVELIQVILHKNLPVYNKHAISAIVSCKIPSKEGAYEDLMKRLEERSVFISGMKWEKKAEKERTFRCNVIFDIKFSRQEVIHFLLEMPEVSSFEIP